MASTARTNITESTVRRPICSAQEKGAILEKAGGNRHEKVRREVSRLRKRRWLSSPVQAGPSEEGPPTRSSRRPAQLRIDPNQSNIPDGSHGAFPGANSSPYQGAWNPYMYGYQGPPSWFRQGFQQLPPNVLMMPPSTNVPQVQNAEADVEEVPAPAGNGRRKNRIKLSNFNPDEDVYLVKSWLEMNCDPNTSFLQIKDSMWHRIVQRYNSRRGSYPERTLRSLQSRWDRIKAEVGKFSSFYADAIRENPSGMSDADKTNHAAANFAASLKQKFAFMHCWEIMKDEPKWQDPRAKELAKSAGGDGFGEDGSHHPDNNDLGDDNCCPTGSAGRRPMGTDSDKAAKKKAVASAGSTKELAKSAGGDGFGEDGSHHPDNNDLGDDNYSPTGSAGRRPMGTDSDKAAKKKADASAGSTKELAKSAGGDGFGEDGSHHSDNNDLGDDNCSPTRSAGRRPMGTDSDKAAKKKADASAGSTSSSEHASRMQDLSLQKMDPNQSNVPPSQSNVPDGSPGAFPGANSSPYQGAWKPYMYGYQGPPSWFPQGFQQLPPNVPMMHPSTKVPQLQNDEADVEEVPAPAGNGRREKVATRTKLSNFNPDEDVYLVKSWLEINCDPNKSCLPIKDRMWDRIRQRYNSRRGSYPERTLRSIQSRWGSIKAEVGKFSSFYADAIRENPNGMSDADKTTRAAANFASSLKQKFAFMHCWEIMKDEPKWQDPKAKELAKSAGGDGFGEDVSHHPDNNDLGDDNCSPTGSAGRRPMGTDSDKEAKKKADASAASTSSSEHASTMQDLSLQKMDPNQSNVAPSQSNVPPPGAFPGANSSPYQGAWNPYMYGYQGPPSWFPQGFQQLPLNVPMMHPSTNVPQLQNDEADVEEVPAPVGNGRMKKVGTRTKLSNFSPNEDVYLVKSWLEINCDPNTSFLPIKDSMWDRIVQRYNSRRGSYPERTLRSIQSRWDRIKAEVGKFSSFYADAIRENPSGMSDADKTNHAAANFASSLKQKFAFMHCWEIMKDEPKWQDPKAKELAKSAGGDGFGEDGSNHPDNNDLGDNPDNNDLGDDNCSPTGSAGRRPMDTDSDKAAKKKADASAGSTSSSEHASRTQDLSLQKNSILQEESGHKNDCFQQLACIDEKRFEEMRSHNKSLLDIELEKIRIMREKHEMDRQEREKQEDERILGIDLNGCTPAQRKYYEALQEEILEKIAARRRKRQEP